MAEETLRTLAGAVAAGAAEEYKPVPGHADRFHQIVERHAMSALEHVEDEGRGRVDALSRDLAATDKRLLEVRAERDTKAAEFRRYRSGVVVCVPYEGGGVDRYTAGQAAEQIRVDRGRLRNQSATIQQLRRERDDALARVAVGPFGEAIRKSVESAFMRGPIMTAMDRAKRKHDGGATGFGDCFKSGTISIPIQDGDAGPEDCEEHETCRSPGDTLRECHEKYALEVQRRRSQEVLAAERLELIEECAAELAKVKSERDSWKCESEKNANAAADFGQKWQEAMELAIERQKTIVTLREQHKRADANWTDAIQRSIVRGNELEALKREGRITEGEITRLRKALISCLDHCEPVDAIVAEALGCDRSLW